MLLFVYAHGKRITALINANACGCVFFIISEPENDRWGDLSRKCPLQIEQPGTNIWDCLADKGEEGTLWPREATSTCSVTNLIKELSLSDPHSNPSAPPSKRQCRSLSFSDEMSSCRTSWRPLGSKVWTPVEKRRCYSGGSVQRYSNGSATMQRSSSFSLPSRSHPLASSCDHRPGCPPRRSGAGGDAWSPEGGWADMQRSLSCSHDRFSSSEPGPPSASSTPASTPQLGRRAGGLCRSRSQPCVLNDKKVGVKRRRPQDAQEPRPSLDLAKMTQVRLGTGHKLPLPCATCCGGAPAHAVPQQQAQGSVPIAAAPLSSKQWFSLRCLCSQAVSPSEGCPSVVHNTASGEAEKHPGVFTPCHPVL